MFNTENALLVMSLVRLSVRLHICPIWWNLVCVSISLRLSGRATCIQICWIGHFRYASPPRMFVGQPSGMTIMNLRSHFPIFSSLFSGKVHSKSAETAELFAVPKARNRKAKSLLFSTPHRLTPQHLRQHNTHDIRYRHMPTHQLTR